MKKVEAQAFYLVERFSHVSKDTTVCISPTFRYSDQIRGLHIRYKPLHHISFCYLSMISSEASKLCSTSRMRENVKDLFCVFQNPDVNTI
jgi:hypothetical protein